MNFVRQGHQLGCCIVKVSELFSGVRAADEANVERFMSLLRWFQGTPTIARRAAR